MLAIMAALAAHDPDHPTIRDALAIALERSATVADPNDARAAIDRAVALREQSVAADPDNPDGHARLANALYQRAVVADAAEDATTVDADVRRANRLLTDLRQSGALPDDAAPLADHVATVVAELDAEE